MVSFPRKTIVRTVDMPLAVLTNDIGTSRSARMKTELIRVILLPGNYRGKVYRPAATVKRYLSL